MLLVRIDMLVCGMHQQPTFKVFCVEWRCCLLADSFLLGSLAKLNLQDTDQRCELLQSYNFLCLSQAE